MASPKMQVSGVPWANSTRLGSDIASAIGLEERNLASLSINCVAGKPATVNAVILINDDQAERFAEIMRRYKIVPVDGDNEEPR